MTIHQKVKVTIFGMGSYYAEVIGFSRTNVGTLITVRTTHGVCKVREDEVQPC